MNFRGRGMKAVRKSYDGYVFAGCSFLGFLNARKAGLAAQAWYVIPGGRQVPFDQMHANDHEVVPLISSED